MLSLWNKSLNKKDLSVRFKGGKPLYPAMKNQHLCQSVLGWLWVLECTKHPIVI